MGLKAVSTTSAGGGAVSSVSNSDGTLTISPTTGAVVASINAAHSNIFTVIQAINANVSSLVSPIDSATLFQIQGANASNGRVEIDTFGGASILGGRRADGTAASPTAVQANEVILALNARGYGATGYSSASRALLNLNAAENWTDTAQGTYFAIQTTAIGGTTTSEKVRVSDAGAVGVGTSTFGTVNKLTINANNTTDNAATIQVNSTAVGNKCTVYQAFASQTANIFEVQKSDGTLYCGVSSIGNMFASTGQNFFSYNTADQTTNYERLSIGVVSNVFTIQNAIGGTGTYRDLRLIANTTGGGGVQLNMTRSGSGPYFLFNGVATITNAAGPFVSYAFANNASSVVSTHVAINPTITQTATGGYTMLDINPTESTTGSGAKILLSLRIGSTSKFIVDRTGTITNYLGVTTAGWGVPAIYGSGRSTGQTAAVSSVATYTVGAADGSFYVSANVLVTASTTHSFSVQVTYTDEGNTSRTITLNVQQLGGTLVTSITNVTGVGPYEGIPLHIRCKASTAITILTSGTFTSVTYNVEGTIAQIM